MKRSYQYLILFLLIAAIGCDDSPVKVKVIDIPDVEPTSTNIRFVPDTLILNDAISNHLITFSGINFNKHTPDSIIIDNTKFEFQTRDNLLFLSVMALRAGFHNINFYFPSGLITLEKKVFVLYDDDVLPNEKSIYFTPDTLIIDMTNYQYSINLYGTSFYKYKIDSAFIGTEKCILGGNSVSKLPIYTTISKTGNYPVIIYYKGNKIELQKKLIIINTIIDFDALNFNKIIYSVQKVPILYRYSNNPEGQIDFNQNHELNQFSRVLNRNIYTIHFSKVITDFWMSIEFDSQYRIIKKLTSSSYNRSSYDPPYVEHTNRLTLYNLPFKVNIYDSNKIELAIDLIGSIINDYSPLTVYEYAWWGGSQKNHDRTYGFTTTKVEPLTGRKINYFPATDSSAIGIYLRNY